VSCLGHGSLGRYFCRRCCDAGKGDSVAGAERFSFGIYAGMLCDACWAVDGKNHDTDGVTFDPADAGERLEEE
jgi:hypothetical protein